jgi:hypothetical protein
MRDQLPVESLVGALQDSVHKECGGVRAVSGRLPCNPMATQCPRCNNSVAECDFGRDTDLDRPAPHGRAAYLKPAARSEET